MKRIFGRTGARRPCPTRFVEALEDRRLLAAVLVKDVNTNDAGGRPDSLVEFQGSLFYAATHIDHGSELWRSDGTEQGTALFADLVQGPGVAGPRLLTVMGDTLYFLAFKDGPGLWKSDGTVQGTQLVKHVVINFNAAGLVPVNGTLFFIGSDGGGWGLWKSDGTPEGTTRVKDIRPGASGSDIRDITNVNGTAYFVANDGVHGAELWKSDGTEAGTVLVEDVEPGATGSDPRSLTAVGDEVFFAATSSDAGRLLWRSDGTESGTAPIPDAGASPDNLVELNGLLYFANGVLRRTDGTPEGTQIVDTGSGAVSQLTRVGDRLFFQGWDSVNGQEIWVTDGTSVGSRPVSHLGAPHDPYYSNLTDANGTLYFVADEVGDGAAIWKSDGTPEGTMRVARIFNGATASQRDLELTPIGDTVYFVGDDGTTGPELWRTDGTPEGTGLVRDLPGGTLSSYPGGAGGTGAFHAFGDVVYFRAATGSDWRSTSMWQTDGSAEGTVPAPHIGDIVGTFGGKLVMMRSDAEHGYELWTSDGTPEGTSLLKDIVPGPTSGSDSYGPGVAAGASRMFFQFARSNGLPGWSLWVSDGTTDGTLKVRDFTSPLGHRSPIMLGDDSVLFVEGIQLWRSDGTSAGTNPVFGPLVPRGPYVSGAFTRFNGAAYFQGVDAGNNSELWRTDGTAAGTVLVKDINPGPAGSSPKLIQVVGDHMFFTADDGVHGAELWVSDGTEAGTRLVKDAKPGPGSGYIARETIGRLGDLAFYMLDDGVNGDELWRSDGTAEGTFMLNNITPFGPSVIQFLTEVNGTLYFTNWIDIWRTDGTVEGTVKVTRNGTGPEIDRPDYLTELNGGLVFSARSDATGYELWKIEAPTADAGTSYTVAPGGVVMLDGTGSSDPDPEETLGYHWDLDGDGVFGEFDEGALRGMELGPEPEFSAEGLAAGTYPVRLRVTNGAGLWDEASADVVVADDGGEDGVKTIEGDETEDDQWSVRAEFGEVQVYRRAFFGGFILQDSWPASEVDGLRFLGLGGDDQVWVADEVRAGVTFDGGDGNDTLLVTADNDDGVGGTALERLEVYQGARAVVDDDLVLEVLDLGEDGDLVFKQGAAITVRTGQLLLDAGSGSTLDVGDDGRLIVEGGDVAAIEALVATARNAAGGQWTGPGITSTAAVGQPLRGVVVFNAGGGGGDDDVVVIGSYNGDVNGDGLINADDYFRIDSGFLAQPANAVYGHGDFNFDEVINADDYFLIDSAFLGQGTVAASISSRVATATTDRGSADEVRRKKPPARPVRDVFARATIRRNRAGVRG